MQMRASFEDTIRRTEARARNNSDIDGSGQVFSEHGIQPSRPETPTSRHKKRPQPKLGPFNNFNRATRLSGKRLLSNYFRR